MVESEGENRGVQQLPGGWGARRNGGSLGQLGRAGQAGPVPPPQTGAGQLGGHEDTPVLGIRCLSVDRDRLRPGWGVGPWVCPGQWTHAQSGQGCTELESGPTAASLG